VIQLSTVSHIPGKEICGNLWAHPNGGSISQKVLGNFESTAAALAGLAPRSASGAGSSERHNLAVSTPRGAESSHIVQERSA
jgi:hypothetical protein